MKSRDIYIDLSNYSADSDLIVDDIKIIINDSNIEGLCFVRYSESYVNIYFISDKQEEEKIIEKIFDRFGIRALGS